MNPFILILSKTLIQRGKQFFSPNVQCITEEQDSVSERLVYTE